MFALFFEFDIQTNRRTIRHSLDPAACFSIEWLSEDGLHECVFQLFWMCLNVAAMCAQLRCYWNAGTEPWLGLVRPACSYFTRSHVDWFHLMHIGGQFLPSHFHPHIFNKSISIDVIINRFGSLLLSVWTCISFAVHGRVGFACNEECCCLKH